MKTIVKIWMTIVTAMTMMMTIVTIIMIIVKIMTSMMIVKIGGSTHKGEKIKVKKLKGALSNPIPLVKRSSEQFLFLRLHVWKVLPSIFWTSMGISMGK